MDLNGIILLTDVGCILNATAHFRIVVWSWEFVLSPSKGIGPGMEDLPVVEQWHLLEQLPKLMGNLTLGR